MYLKKIASIGEDLYIREDLLFFRKGEKFFQYNGVNIQEISKSLFLQSKFGMHYEKIIPLLESDDERAILTLDRGVITCGYRNFIFQWFSSEGDFIHKREDIGFDSIYGFDINKTTFWYVIPTHDYIGVFSLEKNKDLNYLEGLSKTKYFSLPQSIRIYQESAYVADMGNKRVIRFSLLSLVPETYLSFQEPVFDYLRTGNNEEFVLLASGIYKVTKSAR